MIISSRGEHALKLMLDLAVYGTEGPVRVKDIAHRQNISEKYLAQIISELNQQQFVIGYRGSQGGYVLRRKPKDYTVGEILRCVEGNFLSVDEVDLEKMTGDYKTQLAVRQVKKQIGEAVGGIIDHITLLDLIVIRQSSVSAVQNEK